MAEKLPVPATAARRSTTAPAPERSGWTPAASNSDGAVTRRHFVSQVPARSYETEGAGTRTQDLRLKRPVLYH